jgi:hypothetical protein
MYRIVALLFLAFSTPGVAHAVVCPEGFLEVLGGTNSLGCIQESEATTPPGGSSNVVFTNYVDAIGLCLTNHGGRLPTLQEAVWAESTLPLIDLQDDEPEWLADLVTPGSIYPGCMNDCAVAAAFSFGQPDGNVFYMRPTNTGSSGSSTLRCFIPAESLGSPTAASISTWTGVLVTMGFVGAHAIRSRCAAARAG